MHRGGRTGILTFLAAMQFTSAVVSMAYGIALLGFIIVVARAGAGGNVSLPVLLVGLGLIQLVCAVGLWKIKRYGRTLALAFGWISVIAMALQFSVGTPELAWISPRIVVAPTPLTVGLTGIGLRWIPNGLVAILMLAYLYTPRINALFAAPAA